MHERSDIITLEQISLTTGRVSRLSDLSIALREGRTAIVGFSGAGKSSLLGLLAKFEHPTGGTIDWQEPIGDFSLPVFWAPQDNGLWPHLTVRQHLEAVTSKRPGSESAKNEIGLDKKLKAFDLEHREAAFPGQLSKGEQNRLAVLRCLVADPAVILLDEPLAHVDPKRQPEYWKQIEEHVQQRTATLIFATHQPDIALAHSEHCLCLNQGRVVWFGPTNDLYSTPPSQQIAEYLGANNWFSEAEVRTLLLRSEQSISCRPERLHLTVCSTGTAEVTSTVFSGSYAVTQLRDIEGKIEKEVIHRPPRNVLQSGDRVSLEVLT